MDVKLKNTFIKLFYSTNERIASVVEVKSPNKVRKRIKFLAFSSMAQLDSYMLFSINGKTRYNTDIHGKVK